jgi:hypothetical protein
MNQVRLNSACHSSAIDRLRSRVGVSAFLAGLACLGLILLGLAATPAFATVQSQIGDDVWPMDNPFTSEDEGLPDSGNQISILKGMTAADQGDPRTDYGPLPLGYEEPYFESHLNVFVGRTGNGSLIISSPSQLRYEDLTIGETYGSNGYMRIQGFSSLYNNNYLLLPPAVADGNPFGINWGTSIREADDMDGFDLYVGQGGTGTLEIVEGGRAEIEDAVSIGDEGGSVGIVKVDGTGSLLDSGGFMTSGPTGPNDVHQFVVGRLGSGTVTITNGGKIFSRGPQSATGNDIVGAAIGGPAHDGTTPPDAGGTGVVKVDGVGSSWVVGGDLQVGAFHANQDPVMGDLEGDNVVYASNVGKGTLTVSNGALVTVVSPVANTGSPPPELNMLIGRRGTVNLQGGRIELQGGFEPGNGTPVPFIDDVQVINDGLIQGDGSIETGVFNNRYQGIVMVSAGQKLEVDSTTTIFPPMHRDPFANWGVIEALGNSTQRAELVFNRVPDMNTDIRNAFHNYRLTTPPVVGRAEGQIIAQDATLRFYSGLDNQGSVSFSGGTNVVTGAILNEAPMGLDPGGVIFVSGDNTTVLFENEIINNGVLALAPNISLVTILEGLTMGGTSSFSTAVGGRPTGQEISNLSVVGDIALDGELDVSLFTAPGVPAFSPQPGDTFEIMSSLGEMTGDFSFINLPFVSPTVGLFAFPDYALDAYFVTAVGFNPMNGADFNGDGIVDDADLNIIRQNLGNPGGLGDANNDGIVNGQDLFIWQMQAGGPGMAVPGAGAGSGSGAFSAAVPEPSSLVLSLSGGLLALAAARRRRR